MCYLRLVGVINLSCNVIWKALFWFRVFTNPGGSPYIIYIGIRTPQRVSSLSRFGLKTGIDFAHYGLKLMDFRGQV